MNEDFDSSTSEPRFLQCPFLGTLKEPDHFVNSPSHANFCHKSEPGAFPSIALQKRVCLSPLFAECPIYTKPTRSSIPDELQWKSPLLRLKGSLTWTLVPVAAIGFLLLLFLVGNNNHWWSSTPFDVLGPEASAVLSNPNPTPASLVITNSSAPAQSSPTLTPTLSVTPTPGISVTPTPLPFFLRIFPPKMTPTPSATPQASHTILTFEAGPYIYRGTAFRAKAYVEGPGGLSEPVGVTYSGDCTNVSAGGCTATAIYSGDTTHQASSDSKSINILPAPSLTTVTFEPGPYVYRGAVFPATAIATGVGGLNARVVLVYSNCVNVTFTNGCTATATFAGDTNHTGSTGSAYITITKAASTTVVTFETGPYAYRGTAFTATALATGAGALNAPAAVVYTGDCTNVSAGGCTASATFSDANHTASSDTKHIDLAKAPSITTVSFAAGPYVYTGYRFNATATATGAGGLNVSVSLVYTNCINVTVNNGCTATASFLGDLNHAGSSGSASITISPASSITTVTFEPGPYTYRGSAFTATARTTGAGGLNVAVLGVTYSPTSCLNVGGCTANATYAGDANHLSSTGSSLITITAAPVTVTAGSLSATYNGSTQSPTPCAIEGTYIGNLSCANNPSLLDPNVGTGTISPQISGSIANFAVTSHTGSWTITPAPVTFTAGSYTGTYDGSSPTLSGCTAYADPWFSFSCTNNPPSIGADAGEGTVTPVYGDLGDNFTVTANNSKWTIEKASSTTVVTFDSLGPYYYTGSPYTASATVTGAGGLNESVAVTYEPAECTNLGSCTATATFDGDLNHTGSSNSQTITIEPAPLTYFFHRDWLAWIYAVIGQAVRQLRI